MRAPKAPPSYTVVVAGDLVVDHHLYEGERFKPDSSGHRGVRHVRSIGGAAGILRLLEALEAEDKASQAAEVKAKAENSSAADPRSEPRPIACSLGVADPDIEPSHAPHHAFAVWRPHKMTRKKNEKQLVWRTNLAMGYGHDPIPSSGAKPYEPARRTLPTNKDLLVLDDAGSLFRKGIYRESWHLPDPGTATWIMLKLSDPIAHGDLWRALVPNHAKRVIVVVSAEDLRRETVRIGERLSWERTLEDLAAELQRSVLKPLEDAAHLMVTFGGDAAIWISRDRPKKARFCFDAAGSEGEFAAYREGRAIGYMTCMAAALAYGLTQAENRGALDLGAAMGSGLRGMRDLLNYGHGLFGDGAGLPEGFPVSRLAKAMLGRATEETDFAQMEIAWPPPASARGRWTLAESSQRPFDSEGPRPLVGLATEALRRGKAAYFRLPHLRFGAFVTAERAEIEALRGIRQLMRDYDLNRPLSIGVFGPPGAGKSFAVKQMAIDLFGEEAWLEFNLSQFEDERDLIGALHQVRDKVLSGIVPVAFWDEFDSQSLRWLRSLLAPMQDGKFQEGQITHPVGRAIFIFAGGTKPSFSAFGPDKGADGQKPGKEDERHWRLSKGPDFKSRLDAYYDVVGPNRRRLPDSDAVDPFDIAYPLRRALLIRGQLRYSESAPLQIDSDLARALLLAPDYTYGSRSLEKLVLPLAREKGGPLRRSALPPQDQISMHLVKAEAFFRLLDRDTSFAGSEAIDSLAKAIHGSWRTSKEEPGVLKATQFDREWNELDEAGREDNRAAARRIPAVLALAGLGITGDPVPDAPAADVLSDHLEHNIERLAEAEHDGWKDFRERNGWRYAPFRDNKLLLHPLLVPYSKLSEPAKDKDRRQIRLYPEMVAQAGFRIVWLDDRA